MDNSNNNLFTGKYISFELHAFKLQFEITRNYSFPYYHGALINSLLSTALGRHPLGKNIFTYPVESGGVYFKKGSLYNLGLSILGNEITSAEQIKELFANLKITDPGDVSNVLKFIDAEEVTLSNAIPASLSQPYHLKFITPLRHARKDKEKGKRFFDPSLFDPEYFLELLLNRMKELSGFINLSPSDSDINIPPCKLLEKNLIWIDMPFGKTIGGIIGEIKFNSDLSDFWKEALWCGQFIHAGLNSSFGFGKYIIKNFPSPDSISSSTANYISKAESILEEAIKEDNLAESFKHIKSSAHTDSTSSSAKNKEKYEEFEKSLADNLKLIKASVKSGDYIPGDLIGMMIDKGNNDKRALAVPDIKDRILQRSVVNIISPAVEKLLEASSYAYRKGISRKTAVYAIKEAKANGMQFVLKCDIEAFFDNVDWQILFKKLDILYEDDPILALLKIWIKQPVILNGIRIIRRQGLPQGSPLSPLLANLYLDQFDEEIEGRFKLIRYADDILILCKSKEDAEAALQEVEESLTELKLEINRNKEGIFTFEEGFQYLGYLFNKSLIMEKEKSGFSKKVLVDNSTEHPAIPVVNDSNEIVLEDDTPVHKNNWIASADINKIKPLDTFKLKSNVAAGTINSQDELRTRIPLYINGYLTTVRTEGETLVIINEAEKEAVTKKIPFEQISLVLFLGKPRVSFPAIVKLKESDIPLYFAYGSGKLYLSILNEPRNYTFWMKQLKLGEDESFKLSFAKNIVQTKIHNCKTTIGRNEGEGAFIDQLNHYEDLAANADSIDSLRGVEGKASAIYFEAYAKLLNPEWKFEGRQKHPAVDPVNAMLSLGYTFLYNHIATALQAYGINPEIGFYHVPKPNHFALASDLIEEMRFMIDRLVLYLINRNMITPADFSSSPENGKASLPARQASPTIRQASWMNFESRKKFIAQFEMRLNTKFSPEGMEGDITYFQHFYFNAQRLRKMILSGQMNYSGLKVK